MHLLKGANTIEEAVGQFYENPNKYSYGVAPSMSKPVVSAPPPYAAMSASRHRPYTNAVIEAGHVRARDEVRFTLTSVW